MLTTSPPLGRGGTEGGGVGETSALFRAGPAHFLLWSFRDRVFRRIGRCDSQWMETGHPVLLAQHDGRRRSARALLGGALAARVKAAPREIGAPEVRQVARDRRETADGTLASGRRGDEPRGIRMARAPEELARR